MDHKTIKIMDVNKNFIFHINFKIILSYVKNYFVITQYLGN